MSNHHYHLFPTEPVWPWMLSMGLYCIRVDTCTTCNFLFSASLNLSKRTNWSSKCCRHSCRSTSRYKISFLVVFTEILEKPKVLVECFRPSLRHPCCHYSTSMDHGSFLANGKAASYWKDYSNNFAQKGLRNRKQHFMKTDHVSLLDLHQQYDKQYAPLVFLYKREQEGVKIWRKFYEISWQILLTFILTTRGTKTPLR